MDGDDSLVADGHTGTACKLEEKVELHGDAEAVGERLGIRGKEEAAAQEDELGDSCVADTLLGVEEVDLAHPLCSAIHDRHSWSNTHCKPRDGLGCVDSSGGDVLPQDEDIVHMEEYEVNADGEEEEDDNIFHAHGTRQEGMPENMLDAAEEVGKWHDETLDKNQEVSAVLRAEVHSQDDSVVNRHGGEDPCNEHRLEKALLHASCWAQIFPSNEQE